MGDILDHIRSRRSIRRFRPEPLPSETLQLLLEAAMAAPSASNRKPWEFVVVTEPEVLAGLKQRLVLGRYNATAAIVVCGNLRRSFGGVEQGFWIQDCSAATQNILLAAAGLGLGSVWIGVHPIAPFSLLVSRWLHLPKHVRPLGVVYLGFPDEFKEPRSQYDAQRVHWQRFGSDKSQARIEEQACQS